jgi:hypothetical protein
VPDTATSSTAPGQPQIADAIPTGSAIHLKQVNPAVAAKARADRVGFTKRCNAAP